MKSIIITSIVVTVGTIFLLKPMTAKDVEVKSSNMPVTRFEVCPVVGDIKPSNTSSSDDVAPYDHCVHCNTGALLAHDNEIARKCTYCGKSE